MINKCTNHERNQPWRGTKTRDRARAWHYYVARASVSTLDVIKRASTALRVPRMDQKIGISDSSLKRIQGRAERWETRAYTRPIPLLALPPMVWRGVINTEIRMTLFMRDSRLVMQIEFMPKSYGSPRGIPRSSTLPSHFALGDGAKSE